MEEFEFNKVLKKKDVERERSKIKTNKDKRHKHTLLLSTVTISPQKGPTQNKKLQINDKMSHLQPGQMDSGIVHDVPFSKIHASIILIMKVKKENHVMGYFTDGTDALANEVYYIVSFKALKILHNSSEFMPYVIFIAAPGMEQLKHLYGIGRSIGSSNRNLTVSA
jgi:hypothetical protein